MKHKLTIHYSITNCGDGSAALTLHESAELAEYDQGDDNGWGEPCFGSIDLESDSPITVKEEIETKEAYLIRMVENDDSRIDEFIEEFFPNGLPKFSVVIDETYKDKRFHRNLIYADGREIASMHEYKENSGEALLKRIEDLLNE